jgi:dihydrolipoamide dehydrogenase
MASASTENRYNVIVIGAGPIGQTGADRTRPAGLSVAAVERELVGGECTYWACIPSKAMLRPHRHRGRPSRRKGTGSGRPAD